LKWRLGRPIGAADAAAIALFAQQLAGGLEEVHVEAHRPVELGERAIGVLPLAAVVAHELADHRMVLLLHEALIVLIGGAPPREGDLLLGAVGEELRVQELAAVVGVQPEQPEG